jgi:excisionase family DNA binding protein
MAPPAGTCNSVVYYNMLTVPEAARRIGRDPETIRRWIRAGRLRAHKIGTQHVIDEGDLEAASRGAGQVVLPDGWKHMMDGRPMPNIVAVIRGARASR